jgi:hypothetical protein
MMQELKSLREEVMAIKTEKRNRDLESIPALAANLLTDVLKKLSKSKGKDTSGHSTTRLIQAATTIDEKSFVRDSGLPKSCFKTLQKYPNVSQTMENS